MALGPLEVARNQLIDPLGMQSMHISDINLERASAVLRCLELRAHIVSIFKWHNIAGFEE